MRIEKCPPRIRFLGRECGGLLAHFTSENMQKNKDKKVRRIGKKFVAVT